MDINSKVNNFLHKKIKNYSPDMDKQVLLDLQGWDSFKHVSFLLEIQKIFKIKFTPKEIIKNKTIGMLKDLVIMKATKNYND